MGIVENKQCFKDSIYNLMKVKDALFHILRFGKENRIHVIMDNRKIFRKIIDKFGERDSNDLSTIEISPFLKKELRITADFLNNYAEMKRATWNKRYRINFVTGKLNSLPWESKAPNSALVRLFNKKKFYPKKILEIGCGSGTNAIFMAQKGYDVTGVDISLSAIKIAKWKAEKANISCNFLNKNILEARFRNSKFGFIFDKGCFHHLPFFLHGSYKNMVKKLLVPGGYFHLICHNPKGFPMKYLYPYLGALTNVINYICEGSSESFFTEQEIYKIFSDQFRVLEINIIHDDMGRSFDFLSCIMKKRP